MRSLLYFVIYTADCCIASAGALLNDIIQLPNLRVFALVRTSNQADKVTSLGATPLQFDMSDDRSVEEMLLKYSSKLLPQMSQKHSLTTRTDGSNDCYPIG